MLRNLLKLFNLSFEKYMKLQIWLCCMTNCIPYCVKDDRLQIIKSYSSRFIYFIQIIVHFVYLFAMILFISSKAMDGNPFQTNELVGVVFLSLNILCFICRASFTISYEEGAKLVNMVFTLAERKDWVTVMPVHANTVYIIGTSTGVLFPGLILSLLLFDPCTPPYLSSMFLCTNNGTVNFTYFLVIAISLDCLMWCHIPGPVALYLGNFFYCFTLFINLTLKSSGSEKCSLKIYKCMQILTNQLNQTFSNLLPLVLATVSFILIFTSFICIRLSSSGQGLGFLIFPLTVVDCILIVLVEFSSAGFVNSNSTNYVQTLKSRSAHRSMNLLPLRVQLGSVGWVEKTTPLVVLDFCSSQTAGLLLVIRVKALKVKVKVRVARSSRSSSRRSAIPPSTANRHLFYYNIILLATSVLSASADFVQKTRKMSSTTKVAVVTGSNKGIGLAIARNLCKAFEGDVLLTSRNEALGKEAVELLTKEGLSPKYHQLDIDSQESIDKFRDFVKNTYGGLDVLVNNAGIAFKHAATEPFSEQAEVTCRVNFVGTMNASNALFPLLRPHARVVNLSSSCGHLSKINGNEPAATELKKKFANPDLTVEELTGLVNNFVELTKTGNHVEHGWPNSAYNVSKVAVSALSRIQQREVEKARPNDDILINHVHPGYVDTDMTSHKGPLTTEQGAAAATWLALLPVGETIKGAYVWHDKSILDWESSSLPAMY